MTGIATYAYLYLHGENRLQYHGLLRDREALERFLGDTLEGALLYSGYEPPDHALLTDSVALKGANEGVALCPVTEVLVRRHEMVPERLSGEDEGRIFSLGGRSLNETIIETRETETILTYEDQPQSMRTTAAFQQVFQHHPEAPARLLELNITCMVDFNKKWITLPVAIANAIAVNHYFMAAKQALQLVPDPGKADLKTLAEVCIKVANAFPPWVDTWKNVLPHLDVRTSNVLLGNVSMGPHALARLTTEKLIGLPNLGQKSLRTLSYALTSFLNNPNVLLLVDVNSATASLDAQGASSTQVVPLAQSSQGTSKIRFSTEDVFYPGDILEDTGLPSTLQGIVERAFTALPAVCKILDIKPHNYLDAITDRLKGVTLEVCGKQRDVTREAIRQNEGKVTKWLSKTYPQILDEMKALCSGEGEIDMQTVALYRDLCALASIQVGLKRLLDANAEDTTRSWLPLLTSTPHMGTIENDKLLFQVLSISPFGGGNLPCHFGLLSHGFSRADAPEESIVLPLPDTVDVEDVQAFIHDTLLPSLVGLENEVAHTTGVSLLASYGFSGGVVDLLLTFALIHWLMQDNEGRAYLPYAISDAQRERQEALDLIKNAKRPLHIVEDIFNVIRPEEAGRHRPHAAAGNWITSLQDQLHSSDTDYPVNIGNSYIATINQLGIASENIGECAAYMESIMAQSPGREFSARELADALLSAKIPFFPWLDAWPGHPRIITRNIAHVILVNQRRPNTRNMGRFVWKYGPWTDEADTESRTLIYSIYKDLFSERRQPIRAQELIEAVEKVRGRGVGFDQVHEINGLVRLKGSGKDALFWDTDLGSWPNENEVEGSSDSGRKIGAEEYNFETETNKKDAFGAKISTQLQDACKALFKEQRRPMRVQELLDVVEELLGSEFNNDQILEISGLVHLEGRGKYALFWDSDLGPCPNVDETEESVSTENASEVKDHRDVKISKVDEFCTDTHAKVQHACKALFKERPRPMRAQSLIDAVEKETGKLITVDHIQAVDGLIHIQGSGNDAIFWDADLDPWDADEQANVESLQAQVIKQIKLQRGSVPVSRCVTIFHDFYDLLIPLKNLEKAVLLARHPDLEMYVGSGGQLRIDLAVKKEEP